MDWTEPARVVHLLLLRHAKAAPDGGSGDHDRGLTERGRADAAVMGRFLTGAGRVPDLVLTSTALRARATAELAIDAGGWSSPLLESPALYESSVERTLGVVRSCGSPGATLLLVGHEPTWSTLTAVLIGGGRLRMPTAGLAVLTFDLDEWAAVTPGSGLLRALVSPALLEGAGRPGV
jgi:phosphohistidine phosphatase